MKLVIINEVDYLWSLSQITKIYIKNMYLRTTPVNWFSFCPGWKGLKWCFHHSYYLHIYIVDWPLDHLESNGLYHEYKSNRQKLNELWWNIYELFNLGVFIWRRAIKLDPSQFSENQIKKSLIIVILTCEFSEHFFPMRTFRELNIIGRYFYEIKLIE